MPISKRDQRRTADWWRGRTVVNTRPLVGRLAEVPAGTRWTVQHKFKGLELRGPKCPCCGVRVRFKQVPFEDLERVDDESECATGG